MPVWSQPKKAKNINLPHTVSSPAGLHFCGEMVPTEQSDVSQKLAFALAARSGYARHINALKARSAPFFSVIEPILKKHNIPNDFKYLPLIESAWQANAVSSAGAVGYWQFMDETAKDMGLSIAPGNDERTDLRKSTEAACRYLKDLHRSLGSWTLAAAAYNGGLGMVKRKIARSGHKNYYAMTMNPETGYYLYRILAVKELLTNPSYGFGAVGSMLAYSGNEYEAERRQAREMGWLQDQDPQLTGTAIEPNYSPVKSDAMLMDSVLTNILKNRNTQPTVFSGDVAAKLASSGSLKVGQSLRFILTEPIWVGEDQLKAGDVIYTLVDDIDAAGAIFLRATKAIITATNTTIPLSLIAINPHTGLAGIPKPKQLKPGWVVQWKQT